MGKYKRKSRERLLLEEDARDAYYLESDLDSILEERRNSRIAGYSIAALNTAAYLGFVGWQAKNIMFGELSTGSFEKDLGFWMGESTIAAVITLPLYCISGAILWNGNRKIRKMQEEAEAQRINNAIRKL